MTIQTPSIRELQKALTATKASIDDDMIAEDGDRPSIDATLACGVQDTPCRWATTPTLAGHIPFGSGELVRCIETRIAQNWPKT